MQLMPLCLKIILSVFSNHYTYHLTDGSKLKSLNVEKGGTLVIHPGRHSIKKLNVEEGGKVIFAEPGAKTVINVSTLNWKGTLYQSEASPNTKATAAQLRRIARGFKINVLGREDVNVKNFAGTLYAPKSYVAVRDGRESCANSNSKFVGRIAGNDVYLERCVSIEAVKFDPV